MEKRDQAFAESLESRPIRDYLSIGDGEPYARTCSNVLRDCAQANGNPRLGMIAIDASIDLAMIERRKAPLFFLGAQHKLEYMLDKSPKNHEESMSAIQATQRLSDIKLWQTVTNHETSLVQDYDTVLLYAYESLRHAKTDKKSIGLLAESVPVLLGMRALEQPMLSGWHSRFSLTREDNKLQATREENPNWDIAIYDPNNPESFVNPSKKIQVKTSPQSHSSRARYEKMGVKVLSARENGFHNPWQIIASCMKERWPSATKIKQDYLGKHALNGLTLRISQRLFKIGLLDSVPNQAERT